MHASLGAQCDQMYHGTRIFLKLDLAPDQESVLHFFDRLQREYPRMQRMRRREDGSLLLEEGSLEERAIEGRRWVRLDHGTVRFGYLNPPDHAACQQFAAFFLEQAPSHLTLSNLNIERLEVVYGFDMEYAGNHDQLVAETFFADHPFGQFVMGDEAAHSIECEPYFGIALNNRCDVQASLEIKSRTTSFETRTGQYEPEMVSVHLTGRQYCVSEAGSDLLTVHQALDRLALDLAISKAVPLIVNPLALAIASRPS
jgi:hypothetical protein